jgi:hypothetical protein
MSNSKTHEQKHRKSSDKSCSDSSRSDSDREDCDCLKTKDFNQIYKYYKYLLQTDPGLMISGSQGYASATNTISEIIPQNFPVTLENLILSHNVDHLNFYSPHHIRQSGIYLYLFAITTDQATQIALFVNGQPQYLDRVGSNSGAGQILLRGLLKLNNGDSLVIRNNLSGSATFTSNLYVGGTLIGNPSTLVIAMIAPNNPTTLDTDFDLKCLKKKELKLFRKLSHRLDLDPDVSLRGARVYGAIYTKSAQTVPINADIVWDNYNNINGISWSASAPTNITVLEDGMYCIMTILNVNVAAQITLCINNTPNVDTTQGINRGGMLSIRTIKQLYKNDIITIRNFTSTTSFDLVANAGGKYDTNAAILTIHMMGPVVPVVPEQPTKINYCKKHLYKNLYPTFVNYLLSHPEYMIAGCGAYISTMSDTKQVIPVNTPIEWNINNLNYNMRFVTGTSDIVINISGIYELSFDILTDEPAQYTLFVNGVPDLTTTTGRTGGASRLLMKQILKLYADDVISIRNYESNAGILYIALNAGGIEVEKNRTFVLFLLAPLDVKKPCKSMKSTCTKYISQAVDLDKKVYTNY